MRIYTTILISYTTILTNFIIKGFISRPHELIKNKKTISGGVITSKYWVISKTPCLERNQLSKKPARSAGYTQTVFPVSPNISIISEKFI